MFLHFVLVQEHVRDPILDREPASRLWTYEVTLQDMNFEEKVVEFFQHVDVCFDGVNGHVLSPLAGNLQILRSRLQTMQLSLQQDLLYQL